MKFKSVVVVFAATVLGIGAADAATQNPGMYDIESTYTGSNAHTLWMPNLISGSYYWQFESGSFVVDDDGASLNAVAVQNGSTDNKLKIAVELDHVTPTASYSPTKCGGNCSDTTGWDYFRLASSSIMGVAGSALDGLSLVLDDKGPYAQLGIGADDKDDGFGFSMWFSWMAAADNTYDFGTSDHGDFNLGLTPVPLPAAGWLLLAGVGALAGIRCRKQVA